MSKMLSLPAIRCAVLMSVSSLLATGFAVSILVSYSAYPFKSHQVEFFPGTWIAFSCTTNLWGNVEGAFTSDRRDGIYLYNLETKRLVQIVEDAYFGDLDWSPDGAWIVFAASRKAPYVDELNIDLYQIRPDGTGLSKVISNDGSVSSPSWSPTGEEIALTIETRLDIEGGSISLEDIFIVNPSESSIRQLTRDGVSISPSWSPSGQEIAFLKWGVDGLYAITVDGTKEEMLSDFDAMGRINWSPTGDQIAAAVSRRRGQAIEVVHLGKTDRPSTEIVPNTGMNFDPAWSDDGSWIAFTSSIHRGWLQLYLVRPDGSELQQVTDLACHVGSPAWYSSTNPFDE
jgi:Tol biopolymer transport system component